MKSSQTPILHVIRNDLQNMQNRADERKNLLFDYCFFIFFPHPQNFLKIGVYTHPIDLSCHQTFDKNSPTGSGNIGARSWKI